MINKSILTLIVSSPGDLQNGLLALMTTIPQLGAVLVAEDLNSALRIVENHQPALIILGMSTPNMQEVIKQIKEHYPHIQLIVLVEDIIQQKEAEESGADRVLIKGFPAHKLVGIVENIIDRWEDTPMAQTNTEGEANNN